MGGLEDFVASTSRALSKPSLEGGKSRSYWGNEIVAAEVVDAAPGVVATAMASQTADVGRVGPSTCAGPRSRPERKVFCQPSGVFAVFLAAHRPRRWRDSYPNSICMG